MNYLFTGGSIEIPNSWIDRSVHSFVEDAGDGTAKTSLVIHQVPSQQKLEDFIDQQLVQTAQKLNSYRLHRRRAVRRGFEVSYEWRPSQGTTVHQRQIFVSRSPHMVTIVTLTTTSSDVARAESLWAELITSLRITEEANV